MLAQRRAFPSLASAFDELDSWAPFKYLLPDRSAAEATASAVAQLPGAGST